jgi:hypothetical protein
VTTWSSAGPVRRIVTVSDAEGYSKRRDDEQRDLQNRMADIQVQAACNARLDLQQAITQGTGDGSLVAWPPGTSELDVVTHYISELCCELERVNQSLSRGSRIRLRLAISAGLVEPAANGITGQAAIRASVLVNSDPLRKALRNAPRSSLAVILDDKLFDDVVKTGRRGLRPEAYERVVITDKGGAEHVGWITVPKAARPAGPAKSRSRAEAVTETSEEQEKPDKLHRMSTPVKVALIGAVGAIVAAAITAATSLGGSPGGSAGTNQGPTSTAAPPSASAGTTVAEPTTAAKTGKLYPEVTDNHLGTDVFADPMGDAVTSGPVSIPYGTHVLVKCWAPNESGMGSINDFYLIETKSWTGDYAPANTFLNADTTGALDPDVPECPAT